MGEIADMMLDGTLDYETGEYLGDSVGFPRTRNAQKPKIKCPHCNRQLKGAQGFRDHMRDKHEGVSQ